MNRLRAYVRALAINLFIIGNLLLLATIYLWFLADTGRLTITGLEPISVGVATVLSYLGALAVWLANKGETREQRDQVQEQRNRRQLIQNVKATWIEGVRNQALHKSVWIELGLKLEPSQVNLPWHMAWRENEDMHTLPEGTPIIDIFREQAANMLLILGAPGSGKTVTLLDLAQQLLDEAEKDPDAPIPVVFNLSSWATKRRPLEAWLLEELDRTYAVPEKTGCLWLEQDALILLLDGLDEVAESQRKACVASVNAYRLKRGLTGITVCSRLEEYKALTTHLDLLGAVTIQPLTAEQADNYLKEMGKKLKGVRKLLQEDGTLQEWVRSPLFLYVVALAYRGLSFADLRQAHTGSLDQLYGAYTTQMLERHRPYESPLHPSQQARKWLAYLAGRLTERDLTVYSIEQMQPDWLGKRLNRREDDGTTTKLLKALIEKEKIVISYRPWSWTSAIRGSSNGLIAGLVVGLVCALLVGLPISLTVGLNEGLVFGLFYWLITVLVAELTFGLSGGLFGGEVKNLEVPKQGVDHTLKTGLISMFFGLLFGSLFVGPFLDRFFGLHLNLLSGLFGGVSFGLIGGLETFLIHIALRRLLAHYDYLPRQLEAFLEYAKDRLLLHRVGSGYIFIHRTLMEYFAAQDPNFDSSTD